MVAMRKVTKVRGQKFQLFPCNMVSEHEPVLAKTQKTKTQRSKNNKKKKKQKIKIKEFC